MQILPEFLNGSEKLSAICLTKACYGMWPPWLDRKNKDDQSSYFDDIAS